MRSIVTAAALGAGIGLGGYAGSALAQDDAYLWLEERVAPRALEWAKAESGRAHGEITADPRFRSYLDKTLSMFVGDGTVESGSVMGDHYYSFQQDSQNPIGRWQRTTFESYASNAPRWEMLIDFDSLAKRDGVNWVFSYAWCAAPEYRFCSVSMSPDGGDAIAIREFDTQSREFVPTGFNVPPSKSDYTYIDTDTVLLSSALTPDELTASGYPRVVKLWKRGTPVDAAETVYEIAHGDMGLATFELADPEFDRDYLLIQRDIDFYTREWLVYTPGGDLRTIPMPSNMERWIQFEGQLIMNPMGDWTAPNGQVLKAGGLYAFEFRNWVDTGETGTYTELMAPQDRFSIAEIWNTRSRLLVTAYENVQGRVYALDRLADGWSAPTRLRLPGNGVVTIVQADPYGSDMIVAYENMVTPPAYYWSGDEGRTLQPMDSTLRSPRFVTEQFEAVSKDGTRVPYFVARPSNRSGPVPTVLYGYGGFQVSELPWYSYMREQMWLSQGNAWVVANIRGGAELGPHWHEAARRENRQASYDDFAAVAADLIRRGLTTPDQLGIQGASNGGLLVGVALTQRPELYRAAISGVPLLDMMRYTLLPPGASWMAEYGDPLKPEDAAFISRYSPYQNVQAGRKYPSTLFMTSTADDRVHPGHARKMAAKMIGQGHDTLFHEYAEGGHGGSGDLRRRAEWFALEYMFLQRELEGDDRSPEMEVDRSLLMSRLRPGPMPDPCSVPEGGLIAYADMKSKQRISRELSVRALCGGPSQ